MVEIWREYEVSQMGMRYIKGRVLAGLSIGDWRAYQRIKVRKYFHIKQGRARTGSEVKGQRI